MRSSDAVHPALARVRDAYPDPAVRNKLLDVRLRDAVQEHKEVMEKMAKAWMSVGPKIMPINAPGKLTKQGVARNEPKLHPEIAVGMRAMHKVRGLYSLLA